MNATKQLRYLQARKKATQQRPDKDWLDVFVRWFLDKVFLPRFGHCNRDWRTLFESKADVAAFLEDLRNCDELCPYATRYFHDVCHTFDPRPLNQAIADELTQWDPSQHWATA